MSTTGIGALLELRRIFGRSSVIVDYDSYVIYFDVSEDKRSLFTLNQSFTQARGNKGKSRTEELAITEHFTKLARDLNAGTEKIFFADPNSDGFYAAIRIDYAENPYFINVLRGMSDDDFSDPMVTVRDSGEQFINPLDLKSEILKALNELGEVEWGTYRDQRDEKLYYATMNVVSLAAAATYVLGDAIGHPELSVEQDALAVEIPVEFIEEEHLEALRKLRIPQYLAVKKEELNVNPFVNLKLEL